MKPRTLNVLFETGLKKQKVRVVVVKKRQRVEVLYYERSGKPRRKIFPDSREGRNAATIWAEAFARERERLTSSAPPTITHREMWELYQKSPAWMDRRPATKRSYAERWGVWVARMGQDTDANAVSTLALDGFITKLRETPTKRGNRERSINQVRQYVSAARTIYNWAQSRRLLRENVFNGYRWVGPKDAKPYEPEEYTPEEYAKLQAAVSPQDGHNWRIHVALVLGGVHGARSNAVLHLRWQDIDDEEIHWNPQYQKTGDPHEQPLTWDLVAALETARYWTGKIPGRRVLKMSARQRAALDALRGSEWVLPGHGKGAKKPWGYQAMWKSLRRLQTRAGVEHRAFRGMHGLRKHSSGNVADATGDDRLGMEWIGDRDMKQARSYLKRRRSRMERAAAAAAIASPLRPNEGGGAKPQTQPLATKPLPREPAVGIEPTTARLNDSLPEAGNTVFSAENDTKS